MSNLILEEVAPLVHLSEKEIGHLLRGFSEQAVSSAVALTSSFREEDLESCLIGILYFYLPAGTKPPVGRPTGETKLADELGLDSLSLAEAMFKAEELFDVRVENAELADIETLSDACRLLKGKLNDSRSAAASDE